MVFSIITGNSLIWAFVSILGVCFWAYGKVRTIENSLFLLKKVYYLEFPNYLPAEFLSIPTKSS